MSAATARPLKTADDRALAIEVVHGAFDAAGLAGDQTNAASNFLLGWIAQDVPVKLLAEGIAAAVDYAKQLHQ